VGFCEHGNGLLGFQKRRKVIENERDYWFLKTESYMEFVNF